MRKAVQCAKASWPPTAPLFVLPVSLMRALSVSGACAVFIILLMQACAPLSSRVALPVSHAFDHPLETSLGRQVQAYTALHPGESGFYILDTGQQALLQRAALIEAAERSVDAQYYIWNSDVSGSYLARRLLLAADRGVRVRLLLDDINIGERDTVLAVLAGHPNIDIRIYNPFAVRSGLGKWLGLINEFQRLNRRMHNKGFVVDGALAVVGGRNIGDEYFDLHPQVNFRDRDVLAAGAVVRDVSLSFDAHWNSTSTYPISQLAPEAVTAQSVKVQLDQARAAAADTRGFTQMPSQDAASAHEAVAHRLSALTWAEAELISDPPVENAHADTDRPKRSARALLKLVEQSKQEILLETPYLILGDEQLQLLGQTSARGVRVSALTNSLASNDLTTNHAGYARRRSAMLAKGLELHELQPDAAACSIWIDAPDFCDKGAVSLHAKSAVFDRKTVYIGSFNVNLRSIYLNSETVLVIHSAELAQRLAHDIEVGMMATNSWLVSRDAEGQLHWSATTGPVWTHEPATGFWRRFKAGLFKLLPVEKYL